ncbi:FecCD family ABC transporter permease [Rothia nasimurium]|uniref:FecCD family ABC transporter permease n=1 Tax=Rothia nasimurium TaxID=85336 RepID=UPI003BA186AE
MTYRIRAVTLSALLSSLLLGLWVLMQGDYNLTVTDVVAALSGSETGLGSYFVREIRAPRILAALLVGAALGLSGAIFQTITRNPLGSPDVIGFTHGAATGALCAMIVWGTSPWGTALGAIVGGATTSCAVYLLTRSRGLEGFQLILVGLGLGATLAAVNSLLVVQASVTQAQTAAAWLAGSLNSMTWGKVALLALPLALVAPLLLWLARPLRTLNYGDTLAQGIGVPVASVRLISLILGVLLVALATALTGPIAFVALAAPHIARHLSHQAAGNLGTAACTGAFITLAADALGQFAFPTSLQVGVVTGALGGLYLIFLIYRARRKDSSE